MKFVASIGWAIVSVGFCAFSCVCAADSKYYLEDDFAALTKIDAHVHINGRSGELISAARQAGFSLLTINVDYPDFPPIADQQNIAAQFSKEAPDIVSFAGTFSMNKWGAPDFLVDKVNQINLAISKGAVAIKVWKNIGMAELNSQGKLIMIDDPLLRPVFDYLSEQHIPLIGHQGEPHNCWLPVEKMTVTTDKEYFSHHPQYHMYKHPELPGYVEQMAHRDLMLDQHPQINFIGAHLASLEWSVDRLAAFLDKYPHTYVDLAARMGQIQYQAQQGHKKVRQFFIKYADRIVYATDLTQSPNQSDSKATVAQAINLWKADWLFLTSHKAQQSSAVAGEFKGLKLPKDVINKIYYQNALKAFPNGFANLRAQLNQGQGK